MSGGGDSLQKTDDAAVRGDQIRIILDKSPGEQYI
jgi:hypothetical protein